MNGCGNSHSSLGLWLYSLRRLSRALSLMALLAG